MELLDYGVALLGAHCGWGTDSLLYLSVNANTEVRLWVGLGVGVEGDLQVLRGGASGIANARRTCSLLCLSVKANTEVRVFWNV